MAKAKTTEQFREEVNVIWGDILSVTGVYKSAKEKIQITCPMHGVQEQYPTCLLRKNKPVGCPQCGHNKRALSKSLTHEEFERRANKAHNNAYEYHERYTDSRNIINIWCPIHGYFSQLASKHIFGDGCPGCYYDNRGMIRNKGHKAFVGLANKIWDSYYEYPDNYKSTKEPLRIICPIHGEFYKTPSNHTHKTKPQGCLTCSPVSIGEEKLAEILDSINVNYTRQKKFKTCKNKRSLLFDFYLPDYKLVIEYQGLHHYEPIYGKQQYKKAVKHDSIKSKWCWINNITLLTIPYRRKYNMGTIVNQVISNLEALEYKEN